jgi:hypothetical protein
MALSGIERAVASLGSCTIEKPPRSFYGQEAGGAIIQLSCKNHSHDGRAVINSRRTKQQIDSWSS